jgi:hypothetical protein
MRTLKQRRKLYRKLKELRTKEEEKHWKEANQIGFSWDKCEEIL